MLPLIPLLTPLLGKVLDRVLPDKEAQAKARLELETLAQQGEFKELETAASTVLAEIQGESAVQRNWRPHLMYLIMALIVFNGVVVPILGAFGIHLPVVDALAAIPEQLWTLLTIGMGGYVFGRSAEKITKTWKNGK